MKNAMLTLLLLCASCAKNSQPDISTDEALTGTSSIPGTTETNAAQYLGYWCGHEKPAARTICYSYIEGYQQAAAYYIGIIHGPTERRAQITNYLGCSLEARSEDIGNGFVAWLKEDENRFPMPIGMAITQMLQDKYPCDA